MKAAISLFFLLVLALSHAYEVGYDSNASGAMLRIYSTVETNATTQAEYEAFLSSHTALAISGISAGDRLLLDSIKMQNGWLSTAPELSGVEAAEAIGNGSYSLVILVGGPYQNELTASGIAQGWFNETHEIEGGYIIKTGKLANGVVVVSVSSRMGYEEGAVQRTSTASSPLNAFVPEEYVPIAATGISLLMLALVNVGRTVYEFKALELGRKGKKVGEGAVMFHGINLSELAAVSGASLVLGTSISWQYFGNDMWGWVLINSVICMVGALIHEISHRVFAHFFKIEMEYRFWREGSLLTLVSSYLGNAFSIQGFILEEIPEHIPKWKVGLMKLGAPLVSAAVMVVFAWMYYLEPSPIYKVIYSTSALWAMAEILPFGALDGNDIRKWNHTIWFIAFSLIASAYVLVTFFL